MKKICLLLVAGLFLFGCAKKEDSTETSADSTSGSSGGSGSLLISGRVAQGYVKGATVFADVDGDESRTVPNHQQRPAAVVLIR